jgi:Mrp family chromosome partitioning ATPase
VSTVSADLAIAAAQSGDRPVLLLDASGKRPLLATRTGMKGDLSLPDSLAPESRLSACARPSPISNLSLLAMNETGALLGSDACGVSEVLKDLKRDFGFIVVDLPHVESGLCFALAGMLDGVLLVVESHRTAEEAAARARQRLLHANANVLGAILNKYRRDLPAWLAGRH